MRLPPSLAPLSRAELTPLPRAVFDNLRVLHGRSAYTGSRRLCGAYVNGDDYRSRLRGLERQYGGGDPRRRALEGVLRERYGIERSGEGKGTVWEEYL